MLAAGSRARVTQPAAALEVVVGRGVRLQIFTRDPRRAARFYAEVFGWSLPADGDRCCWVITTGDDSRLGIDSADTLLPTIHVDDLDATTQAAVTAGGEILVGRIPVPGEGWLAHLADTDGNLITVMQDDRRAHWPHPAGSQREATPDRLGQAAADLRDDGPPGPVTR